MSRNVWGHVCAKLNGPSRLNDKRSSMMKEWEEYCVLYGQFEDLASHFTRKTIPVKRQVYNETTSQFETEYAFPLYCEMDVDDEDAIDRNEKEAKIRADQQYLYAIWERLEQKMEELCNCDYVHLKSPWTRVSQSYRSLNDIVYENIDVTNDRFVVPLGNITGGERHVATNTKSEFFGPKLERSDLTKLHYRNALMEVIRNQ